MNTSEQINELAAALAKAQGQVAGAVKDKTNPGYKSKYADLASVWDACRSALAANGLSVVQMTRQSERDEVIVVTRLLHASGQWLQGELNLPVTKSDAQGFGSALTYARRYALAAAVGVAPEDDDGNLAAAAKPTPIKNDVERRLVESMNGRPISGLQTSVDAFNALPPEEQQFLRDKAMDVIGDFEKTKQPYAAWNALNLDKEEVLAIWHLFPSDLRSTLKKSMALAGQP